MMQEAINYADYHKNENPASKTDGVEWFFRRLCCLLVTTPTVKNINYNTNQRNNNLKDTDDKRDDFKKFHVDPFLARDTS